MGLDSYALFYVLIWLDNSKQQKGDGAAMLELCTPALINPLKLFLRCWNHFVTISQPFWRDVKIHNCEHLKVSVKHSIWGIHSVTLSQVANMFVKYWCLSTGRSKRCNENVCVSVSVYAYIHMHGGYIYLRTEGSIKRMNERVDLVVQQLRSWIHALKRPGHAMAL